MDGLLILGIVVVVCIIGGIAVEVFKFKERRKVGHSVLYCILNIGKKG